MTFFWICSGTLVYTALVLYVGTIWGVRIAFGLIRDKIQDNCSCSDCIKRRAKK